MKFPTGDILVCIIYSLEDCERVPKGGKVVDKCGECGRDGSSCDILWFQFFFVIVIRKIYSPFEIMKHNEKSVTCSFLQNFCFSLKQKKPYEFPVF